MTSIINFLLVQGTLSTITIWLGSMIIAIILGTVGGIIMTPQVRITIASSLLSGLFIVLRGIPFYVQLLMAYFVIPAALGLALSAETCSILALGTCSASYISAIIHGGIQAVNQGQWQAAQTLGYSTSQTLWLIILPQALKGIIPALRGELDQLLKSTSIVSSIGVLELTGFAKNSIARGADPLVSYASIACIYCILSLAIYATTAFIYRRIFSW